MFVPILFRFNANSFVIEARIIYNLRSRNEVEDLKYQ